VYWDIPPPEKIREGMDRPRTPGTARLDARGALPVCWPLARR
jgi:hypothetical protein